MANLSIRKLDEDVVRKLRKRAGAHGVSMEEEARRILAQAVGAPERLGDLALITFGPVNGVDFDLVTHDPHEPIELSPS